ncbi:MAG: glutamate--cysteine ligase [Candidatus Lokiarchaeota archaeon]|nr:glutamate--cysteine ligase [Candidatus Lokiarchaeota archaeon]
MVLGTQYLQDYLEPHSEKIDDWFKAKLKLYKENSNILPLYSSVDIRESEYKISIVDSNVFPSGFNNLDINARNFASIRFSKYLSSISQNKNILIIPENHTRNKFYLNNLRILSKILNKGGFKTTFGFIEDETSPHPKLFKDSEGHTIKIEKICRQKDKIYTESFKEGVTILNNDLSVKEPKILKDINQPVIPPFSLGWYNRKKSTHFQIYNKYIEELASLASFDPWFLRTMFIHVDDVDFKNQMNLNVVAKAVDMIIEKVSKKYAEYNINESPYVFVKNNSGTYGLGIITVSSGDEIRTLNSKNRKKMIHGKMGSRINSVLIQEGIPTCYFQNNHPAEPVLYSIGWKIVGGFMRINKLRDKNKNLNTKGMIFDKLIENNLTKPIIFRDGKFSIFTMLAKVAILAIAHEQKQIS